MQVINRVRYTVFVVLLLCCAHLALAAPPTEADKAWALASFNYQYAHTTTAFLASAKALESFVATYPDDSRIPQALEYTGICYMREDQPEYDKAINAFTDALAKGQGADQTNIRAESDFFLGECYRYQHQYDKAADSYNKALIEIGAPSAQTLPIATQAQYYLGDSYYRTNHLDDAIVAFNKVPTLSPKDDLAAWALYMVGYIQSDRGKYTEAIAALTRVVTNYKTADPAAISGLRLAKSYIARAATRPAAEKAQADADRTAGTTLIDQWVTNNSLTPADKSDAYLDQGQAYFDLENYPKAESSYAQALALLPATSDQTVKVHLWHAHTLFRSGKFQDAATEYALVAAQIDKDKTDGLTALYWEGQAYYRLGKNGGDTANYASGASVETQYLQLCDVGDANALDAAHWAYWNYQGLYQPLIAAPLAAAATDAAKKAWTDKTAKIRADVMNAYQLTQQKCADTKDRTDTLTNLASLVVASMTTDEVDTWYKRGLTGPVSWLLGIQRATTLLNTDHADDAYTTAKVVLDSMPSATYANFARLLIGASLQKQMRSSEAIPYYQQVLDSKPTDDLMYPATYGLAKAYLEAKRFTDARDMALQLTQKLLPTDKAQQADCYMLLGDAYMGAQQLDLAQTTYQKVTTDYPTSPHVADALADLAWIAGQPGHGDPQKAIAAYKALIIQYQKSQPDKLPEVYFQLGVAYNDLQQFDEAIAAWKNIPATSEFADKAAFNMAWAYRSKKDDTNANAQFQAVIDNFPQSTLVPECQYRIGEYWTSKKEYAKALPYMKAVFATLPATSALATPVAFTYGTAAYNTKDYADAATAFKQAAADTTFTYNDEALFWEAQALEQTAKDTNLQAVEDAYSLYVQKFSKGQRILDAALGVGRIALRRGDTAGARNALNNCLTLTTNADILKINDTMPQHATEVGAEATYWLAESYYDDKSYPDAQMQCALETAYKMEPWLGKSILLTAKCFVATNEPMNAETVLKRLIDTYPPDNDIVKEAQTYAQQNNLLKPAVP